MYIGPVLVSCFYFGLACFQCPCPCPVSLVFVFFIYLCLLVFSVLSLWLFLPVFISSYVLFGLSVVFIDVLVLTPILCFADYSLAFCLCTVIYMITWLLTSICLLTTISVCHWWGRVSLTHFFLAIVSNGWDGRFCYNEERHQSTAIAEVATFALMGEGVLF